MQLGKPFHHSLTLLKYWRCFIRPTLKRPTLKRPTLKRPTLIRPNIFTFTYESRVSACGTGVLHNYVEWTVFLDEAADTGAR